LQHLFKSEIFFTVLWLAMTEGSYVFVFIKFGD